MLKIRVVDYKRLTASITLKQATLRNTFYIIGLFNLSDFYNESEPANVALLDIIVPVTLLILDIVFFTFKNSRTLHDLLGGTSVMNRNSVKEKTQIDSEIKDKEEVTWVAFLILGIGRIIYKKYFG